MRIERLDRHQLIDDFQSGDEALDRFLKYFAGPSDKADAARTYVALEGDEICGFHTLAVGHVEHADAPARLVRGLARHPIPVMLLARLAVSSGWQGRGLGASLLRHAMGRTIAAAEIAGMRALTVHAKSEAARAFYERFDFISSPIEPNQLFYLLKDIRKRRPLNPPA